MRVSYFHFLTFLIFFPKTSFSQEEELLPKDWVYDENERSYNWVPTLLKSNTNITTSLSQFNGYVFNWSPRGQSFNSNTIVDGINWSANLNGWSPSFSYTGMYKIFHNKGNQENFEYSNEGYSKNNRATYLTTASTLFKKGWLIHSGFSNASYINELHFQYSTGKLKDGWSLNSFAVIQNTPNGLLPNGFKKIAGGSVSADKVISGNQTVGFVFWWDYASQGKVSPSVLEAYSLSNQRNYNPSWGWLGGQAYYPNYKQTNVPILSFRYEKKWSEKASLQINLGIAVGRQQSSQLDWTSSSDPRPDYYRYLPSYQIDSNIRGQLTNWFNGNPQALQIDFDRIKKVNNSSTSKRSFYIINKNVASLLLTRASALYKFQFNNYWSGDGGIHISRDKAHYFNIIENLLGGLFYYNYNGWVNDDGLNNSFQNDLQYPDRKVNLGEKWGPDYELQSMQTNAWIQFKNIRPRWELSSGFNYSADLFQRTGFNQNGLFTGNSLGSSSINFFPSIGFKGQILYKLSGRIYFRSIFYNQQYAPSASTFFLDPSLHSFNTPFLLPQIKKGLDLAVYYRGVDTKITLSAYLQGSTNEFEKKLFYHDRYNSFVYGVVGQKESIFQGVESSFETNLFSFFQLGISCNIGNYIISNNPFYEIVLSNDLYKVESGLLMLKNLPATTSPQVTQAITMQFQPTYTSRISITGVYSARRALSYDFYRRSSHMLNSGFSNVKLNPIFDVPFLPDQFVLNATMSKSFNIKKGKQNLPIYYNLSLKNLLNTLIPVLVFEQSRFDYINLNPNKFPLKYLYDQGITYAFGIQLQIQ